MDPARRRQEPSKFISLLNMEEVMLLLRGLICHYSAVYQRLKVYLEP
jgi:hypothetical protein